MYNNSIQNHLAISGNRALRHYPPFRKWCIRVQAKLARRLFGTEIDYNTHPGWAGWSGRTVYVQPCPGEHFHPYFVEVKLSFWDNIPPRL